MESKILEILEKYGPKFPDYRIDTKASAKEIAQLMCDREVALAFDGNKIYLEKVGVPADNRVIKMGIYAAFRESGDYTEEQIQLAIDKLNVQ